MTVRRVEQRLNASVFVKDLPQLRRPHVTSKEAIKTACENNSCQKMTRLAQKKKVSVSTVSRMLKKMGEKSFQENPVKCSNGSETFGEEDPFVELPGESRESNLNFFHEQTFSVVPVFSCILSHFVDPIR